MKVNMAKLEDWEILTSDVKRFIEKHVENEFEVKTHCGLRVGEKTIDSVAIWSLIKGLDKGYHVIYIVLEYNVSDNLATEKAVINSPRMIECHEVLQPEGTDIVKFYIDIFCSKKYRKK